MNNNKSRNSDYKSENDRGLGFILHSSSITRKKNGMKTLCKLKYFREMQKQRMESAPSIGHLILPKGDFDKTLLKV